MTVAVRARTKEDWQRIRHEQHHGSIESLKHAGQETRRIVRKSIKRGKKPSAKGQPPRTRKGQLRKSILYDVDQENELVVIGPAAHLINEIGASHEHGRQERTKKKRKVHPGGVLATLEIGGHGPVAVPGGSAYIRIKTRRQLAAVRRQVERPDADYTNERRARYMARKIKVTRNYPRRPFMWPGLQEVTPRLPKMWAGSVN